MVFHSLPDLVKIRSILMGCALMHFVSPWSAVAFPQWRSGFSESGLNSASQPPEAFGLKSCLSVNNALKVNEVCPGQNSAGNNSSDIEEIVQQGFIHATQYFKYLNESDSGQLIFNQAKSNFASKILSHGNEYINKKLYEIPLLSQAQFQVDINENAAFAYRLNGLFKLKDLGEDLNEKPLGILFAQANAIGTSSSDITTNLGLGVRKRLSSNSMLGLNAFWDYRMTSYSSSYTRWGAGAEVWWDDFKLTNNWYIAGTGVKDININGSSLKERVVPGWDVGLKYRFPSSPNIAVGIRAFRWDYVARSDNSGIEASVDWDVTPRTRVSAWVSNENPAYPTSSNTGLSQRSSDTYIGARFTVKLRPTEYAKSRNVVDTLITEMTQPVSRKYEVLLERYSASTEAAFKARAMGL